MSNSAHTLISRLGMSLRWFSIVLISQPRTVFLVYQSASTCSISVVYIGSLWRPYVASFSLKTALILLKR